MLSKGFEQLAQAERINTLFLFEAVEDLFGNMPPHLLYFHRVGQTAAYRRVTLQRKHLRFLLQTTYRRRIDDATAIALELANDVVLFFGFNRLAKRPLKADLLLKVDPGHLFLLPLRIPSVITIPGGGCNGIADYLSHRAMIDYGAISIPYQRVLFMKVGIIGAMEEEVTLLREQIANRQTLQRAGCEIYTGQINGVEVALLKSGIGKVAAALGTTLLLEQCQPDVVINTGSAGGLAATLNVGDIVVSEEVRYHDADVTAFGYEPGQMAGCPPAFVADPALIELAENCIKQLNLNAVRGLICSGDAFINGAEPLARIRSTFPTVAAVEMEAAAVGHVCHQFGTPFVVVRAISDVADSESHMSFDEFLAVAAKQSSLMVNAMLQALAKRG